MLHSSVFPYSNIVIKTREFGPTQIYKMMFENIETVARFGYCYELNKPEFMATHCLAHPLIVRPTKEFLKITYP